jgi:Neuroendocrine-specific golgi protein P55 (NESP55)
MRSTLLVLALAVLLAGCGSDDERADTETTPSTATTETQTETAETAETETENESEPETETETGAATTETTAPETGPTTSPEDQPGGAGDEEPARSLALLSGRGGRITPRVVRVPAFISIRVELRSADGAPYGLRLAGRTLRAGGPIGSASTLLDGLRPGAAVVAKGVGGGNSVRIEATAEPGP